MCFIFIYSKDIILLILGEQWLAAVEIFQILVLANFFRPLFSTTGFVMITRGETKKYFVVGLFSSILLVIAISVGVQWGVMGVAYGILISRIVFYFPLLHISYKDTPISIRLFFKSIFPALISSLIMGAVLFYLSINIELNNSFYKIAFSLPFAIFVYLLAWIIIPGGIERLKEYISDFLHTFKKTEMSGNSG